MSAKLGKYDGLSRWLLEQDRSVIRCTFTTVEQVVGTLPPSARKHRSWWGSHASPQATAWLSVGFVAEADLLAETVRFEQLPTR